MNDINNSGLGELLRDLKEEEGIGLSDLTVLSPQNDPYRLDTPANHAAGKWFRDQMEACGLLARPNPIHNRGVHYAIVSRAGTKLPSGKPYRNDADCWAFLEAASKAARWLGYVPFERITDARNAPPVIRLATVCAPRWSINVMPELELPDVEDFNPRIDVVGFNQPQPFKLVFFGEKTSLDEVLGPMAQELGADLYLPSGEISDTMLAMMASNGAEDGREMVVLVMADCDPAGYQMAVSIGHKLRALRDAFHPSLGFRVLAPALTVEQVNELGLPSTPLKDTERRADGWRAKHGVEQTEIDALATLNPDALRRIVREACAPYFDSTLARRVAEAKAEWLEQAQATFEENIDPEAMEEIRTRAEDALTALRESIEDMEVAGDDIDIELPPMEVPEPELDDADDDPLVSSDMDLSEHIEALRERKNYRT